MKKIVRLTENGLIGIVKRVISEESTNQTTQERLFTFLKGVIDMSSGGGWGWKPYDGRGVKLTSSMLGNYYKKYNDLYGFKVQVGKPLSWELYPLNPNLGKAEGVECNITKTNNGLYITLTGGNNYASTIDATNGGGFLTTPTTVEKTLEAMKKIYNNYKISMNPRNKR